jgi:hypothetical protein
LILVVIPQTTLTDFENWFSTESNNMGWLAGLPPVYSNLAPGNNDPEPWFPVQQCNPELWDKVNVLSNNYHPGATFEMRSQEVTGGYGHQATYDVNGKIFNQNSITSGSADKVSPSSSPSNHRNNDVIPYVWAAQLDGNPVEGGLFYISLSGSWMRQGNRLNQYLVVRPVVANSKPELAPLTCEQN